MSRSIFSNFVLPVLMVGVSASVSWASPLAESVAVSGREVQIAALDRASAAGETGAPDVPWSEVVRDIQRELTDLGLYNGPIDGRYSADVKSAIERFERLHGRIGVGTPLTDALRSIVSVRDALKLRRNLDQIRERQTDEALQALRASPKTRDLVDYQSQRQRGAVIDRDNCETTLSVDCLLAEARRAAANVSEQNFRDWALREIILTEVRTGRSGTAIRDRLRYLSDPRLVLVAMREVSEALAQDGRTAEALDLAETVPDVENRVRAFAAIATSAAKQGKRDTAQVLSTRVAAQLKKEHGLSGRVAIATALASGLAQAGDIDSASYVLRRAREFASPATASLIRRAEVGMLASTGELGDAADALTALADESASAMIAASASAVARAAFAEDARYQVATLCDLGVVQAAAGNAAAAAKTVDRAAATALRVRNGYPRDYARFRVALAWARIGAVGKADAILNSLGSDLLRAEGYWRVADVAAKAGTVKEMEDFEARALAITAGIENRFDRVMILSDMAVAAAGARRPLAARRIFDDALSAGRGLGEGWWRARAFARLATALHLVSNTEQKP